MQNDSEAGDDDGGGGGGSGDRHCSITRRRMFYPSTKPLFVNVTLNYPGIERERERAVGKGKAPCPL